MLSTNGLLISGQGWIILPFKVMTLKGQCFPTLYLLCTNKVMVISLQNILLMSVLNSVNFFSELATDQVADFCSQCQKVHRVPSSSLIAQLMLVKHLVSLNIAKKIINHLHRIECYSSLPEVFISKN